MILLDLICKPFFAATMVKNWLSRSDAAQLDPKRILMMEIWGIGDIVLLTPAIRALKNKFPDAEITLLATDYAAEVLKDRELVDNFITFNLPWTCFHGKYRFWQWDFKSLRSLVKQLREPSFDLTLDARMDVRNNFLMYLSRAQKRVGYTYTGGGHFLTDKVSVDRIKQHRIDEWTRLLEHIGVPVEDPIPKFNIARQEKDWADDFLTQHNVTAHDLTIGIHPGGGVRKRCWPLGRFAKIAEYARDTHNAKVVVFCEPDGYGEDIPISGEWIKVKVALSKLTCLLARLDLFICNDSGPMHLAAAVGTPLVAIFGPGNLNAIGPKGSKQSIVTKDDVPCRPCRDYCKYKEPFCLTDITVDQLQDQIDREINSLKQANLI